MLFFHQEYFFGSWGLHIFFPLEKADWYAIVLVSVGLVAGVAAATVAVAVAAATVAVVVAAAVAVLSLLLLLLTPFFFFEASVSDFFVQSRCVPRGKACRA